MAGEDRGGGQKVEGAPAGLLVPAARREVVAISSSTFRVFGELRPEIGAASVKLGREEARGGREEEGESVGADLKQGGCVFYRGARE